LKILSSALQSIYISLRPTSEVTLQHLRNDCIAPVFAKDNELTLNHALVIETVQEAAQDFFRGEIVDDAAIRVSHTIKGRIPEAIHKPANQLLESDKTIYYERCAFSIDVPSIWQEVNGNRLNLSIVGVRAYNHTNLMSKKVPEAIRLGIGFKNQVCCNMCIFTDGYKDDLKVSNTRTPFTKDFKKGQTVKIPIAHAEGRFYTEDIDLLKDQDQIVLQFKDRNPNGSMEAITSVCDESGLVCAMMPHPERACEDIFGSDDGLNFFKGFL